MVSSHAHRKEAPAYFWKSPGKRLISTEQYYSSLPQWATMSNSATPSFLRLSASEQESLGRLGPILAARADNFAHTFYQRVQGSPELQETLEDLGEANLLRLRNDLAENYRALLLSDYDDDRRHALYAMGAHYASTGLHPEWLVAIYNLYGEALEAEALSVTLPVSEAIALHGALAKRLELDMFWHLEGYQKALVEDRDRAEDALETQKIFYQLLAETLQMLRDREMEPPEQIFQSLVDRLAAISGMPLVWIGQLREGEPLVRVVAAGGEARAYTRDLSISADPRLPEGQGPWAKSLRTLRPVIFNDLAVADFAPWREAAARFGLGGNAIMVAPTRLGQWVSIGFYRHEGRSFPPEVGELVERIARELAAFLERREVADDLLRLRRYQQAQREIQRELLDQPDPLALYRLLAQRLVEHTDALGAYVAVPDMDSEWLSMAAAAGAYGDHFLRYLRLSKDADRFPEGHLIGAQAYRQRAPVIVSHLSGIASLRGFWEHLPDGAEFLSAGGAAGSWPIFAGGAGGNGEPSAIFSIVSKDPDTFSPDLQDLMAEIAQAAGIALAQYEARQSLLHLSLYDPLTGIPNRAYFAQSTQGALSHAAREGRVLAVGILDLDGFKEVNDVLGHAAGDHLLHAIAQRLQLVRRADDVVARLGGDEFGFALSIAHPDDLAMVSQRILGTVGESAADIGLAAVTASLGWACAPRDGEEFGTLLAHADEAMYAAKTSGNGSYRLYGASLSAAVKHRIDIYTSFPLGVSDGSLRFFLQPQADVLAGRIDGVEMLVRWRRDGRRWTPPSGFMAVVEGDITLIRALGILAMQEAVRLRQRFRDEGLDLRISFNVGAHHFTHPAFLDDVAEHCPNGLGLVVEITESTSLADLDRARGIMEGLKARGFQLSMDDFGTGYASLLSVAELPFDEIKIAQDFIFGLRRHSASFAVVGAARLLGDLSGRSLIAEGIATGRDLDTWLHMGGQRIQGYHLAPPLPENAFLTWHRCLLPITRHPPIPYPVEDLALLLHDTENANEGMELSQLRAERCPLGIWFARARERSGNLPHFDAAEAAHQRLHDLARAGDGTALPTAMREIRLLTKQLYQEILTER